MLIMSHNSCALLTDKYYCVICCLSCIILCCLVYTRLPFAVGAITQLPTPQLHDYYIVSTAFGNQLLLLNVNTGRVQALVPSVHNHLPATVTVSDESFLLQNSASTSPVLDTTTVVTDAEIFATLDTWASHNGVSNLAAADTALSSAFLCSADEQHQQTQLCFVGHSTENPVTADVLYSIRVTNAGNTPHFQVTSSATLALPCRVTHLAVDPDNQQLSVTAENGTILAYSLLNDTVVPAIEHSLTDHSLLELLNSHTAADSLRSQHKGQNAHRSGGVHGEQKKSTITLPGGTVFKTFGAAFYQYNVSQYVDDTRFTNSLKPHTLVYPNTSAANSRDSATRPVSRVASATCVTNCTSECDASHHRTGLMYAVQGYIRGAGATKDSTSDFLLLWDVDHTHKSAQGSVHDNVAAKSSCAQDAGLARLSADRMKVIDLPKGGLQQLYISTATTRRSQSVTLKAPSPSSTQVGANITSMSAGKSRADWRRARQAPRQTVLCLDQQGRLWSLQTTYRTDFPGPMYPVGYTLITKVIKYTETESELDIVPGMPAGGGGSAAHLSSHVASSTALSSNMTSALNSAKVSREDLVGLDIDCDEPSAKRSRTDRSILRAPVNIESLVLDRHRIAASRASSASVRLPFTFVQDYYIAPVSSTSASGGVAGAVVLAVHGSPSRSPRITSSALSNTPGAFSPPRVGSAPPQSASESDGLLNLDGSNAGETAAEEISWSFDEVVPPPVRVLNGDFDAKLGRQLHNADAVLQVMREPTRLTDKLKQMQEEAVAAVVHAEEAKERARLRNAVKKQQKDDAARKALEERARESRIYNAAMSAQAAVQAAAATGGLPFGGDASLTALAGTVYNGGAAGNSNISGHSAHTNGQVHNQSSSHSSMPPPTSSHAGPSNRAARVHSYMPGASVVHTKVTMPHNYLSMAANPSPPKAAGPAGVSFLSPADVLAPRVGSGYSSSPAYHGNAGVSVPQRACSSSTSGSVAGGIAAPMNRSLPAAASQGSLRSPSTPLQFSHNSQIPQQALQQVLQHAAPNAELSPEQQIKLYNFLMSGAPPPAADDNNHT